MTYRTADRALRPVTRFRALLVLAQAGILALLVLAQAGILR
jgi:hypothetical protein